MIVWRQADHAREIDFLLRQIVLEGKQTLLVRQRLHFVLVGIHFRDESLLELLRALLVHGIRALQLRLFRSHPRFRGNRLKIGPADGKHDQFARILGRIAIRLGNIVRGAVVVDRREVENGLRKMGAKIHVVKRADHGRNRKPGKIEPETLRAQIGGLNVLVHRAIDVRQQHAARSLALSLRLPQGLRRARLAEVIGKAALNRFPQAKLSVERHVRDARRASRVGALHLHAWIQRVHRGGGARRGLLRSLHGAARLRRAPGERKLHGLRALRLSGRRPELREDRRGERKYQRRREQ